MLQYNIKRLIRMLIQYNEDIYLDDSFNIEDLIAVTETRIQNRYQILKDFYMGNHPILYKMDKDEGVPDNIVINNFCKYLVDLFNGFYCGNGIFIEYESDDEVINQSMNEAIDTIMENTDFIHKLKKLFKYSSIYGRCYLLFFYDSDIKSYNFEVIEPIKMQLFYDNSIKHTPKLAIYLHSYYKKNDLIRQYYVYTKDEIIIYNDAFKQLKKEKNTLGTLPVLELIENDENKAIFEDIITSQVAYNKTISEYRNDLEQFADQIIKILGFKVDQDNLGDLVREFNSKRIITSTVGKDVTVDYLNKSDTSVSRREMLKILSDNIFYMSLCANVSEKNFGQSTGIAMKYKLLAMFFLANNRDEKVKALIKNMLKILLGKDILNMQDIHIHIKRDIPNDVIEEANLASQVSGLVSRKTALKQLSFVEDVNQELDQIDKEESEEKMVDDWISDNNANSEDKEEEENESGRDRHTQL